MQKRLGARIVAGAVAGVATLWLAAGLQARPNSPATEACTITLSPDTVTVATDPVDVQATLSESVGDTLTASVADDSGIEVLSVTGGGTSASLSLNTSAANAGEWPVTISGESGECRGTVNVAEAGPLPR